MQNIFRVKVLKTGQDLTSERLRDFFIESSMFAEATGDRTTRNVFQEAAQKE